MARLDPTARYRWFKSSILPIDAHPPIYSLLLLLLCLACVAGCKVRISVPDGGRVVSANGIVCEANKTCNIEVADTNFTDTFTAVPAKGFFFSGWSRGEGHFCQDSVERCTLSTRGFEGYPALLSILDSDWTFYLKPMFGRVVPVVVVTYIPTADGVHIDSSLWKNRPGWGLPSEFGSTLLISDVKKYIEDTVARTRFALQEGTRFRGYKRPWEPPYLKYEIVATYDFARIPPTLLTPANPDRPTIFLLDLHKILNEISGRKLVEEDGVKEFWIAMPETWNDTLNMENWESNMSSPTTGDISNSNRDNNDLPIYRNTYFVYTINYFRTQSEAIHNHGHQIEHMLSHVARLQDGNDDLFFVDFVGLIREPPLPDRWATGRCGMTHFPLNARADNDYGNTEDYVESDCEDWRPDGLGKRTIVNLSTWTDIPYAWPTDSLPQPWDSNWFIYWMQNIPGANNQIPYRHETTLENWWEFMGDWDSAINRRLGLHK